jgi:hypothetical protein
MSSENDYRAVSSHAQTMPLFDSQQAVTSGTEKRKGGERLYGNTRGQLAEEGKGEGTGTLPPNIGLSVTTKTPTTRKLDHIKTTIRQDPTVLEVGFCVSFESPTP